MCDVFREKDGGLNDRGRELLSRVLKIGGEGCFSAEETAELPKEIADGYWAVFRDYEAAGEWFFGRLNLKDADLISDYVNFEALGEDFIKFSGRIAERLDDYSDYSAIAVKFKRPFGEGEKR